MEVLTPLPVALPLVVAAVLIACARLWPSQWPDAIASVTAAAVAIIAVFIAGAAKTGPLVYWYGGWTPRHGLAIGIAFVVDSAGAGCAAFVAALFCASFVFSWSYFDEVHARYPALMLIFLAAMAGFAMTGDLFNFFVFFELMSTVAFALTGYKLESPALEGALNFTVTNAIGSFLMLAGIGLLYGRTRALNFAQLSRALSGHPADGLVILSFALLIGALFIKGAIIPFHFWIADAHTVAPSPVCVIFSGIMVPIATGGLLLAGLPVGLEHQGRELIDAAAEARGYAFLAPILSATGGLTGAGILRGAGRIFLGLGPEPGEEEQSPSEQEREKQDRPVWLMLLPIIAMLATELVLQALPIEAAVRSAAASFTATVPLAATALDGTAWSAPAPPPAVTGAHVLGPIIGLSVALGIAAFELSRRHFPRVLVQITDLALGWIFAGLDRLHDGVVGDYVAWLVLGLLVVGGMIAIG